MDNYKFGAFVAQLRKEQNLTQKELADRLHVTDKAVSKWETGKGFPDVKLLEPLSQVLGVSLVELIQGQRLPMDILTMDEAGKVVSQAMDQSQKNTARRYLRLLRWILVVLGIWLAYLPLILLGSMIYLKTISLSTPLASSYGIIGGADGPTAILVSSSNFPFPGWVELALQCAGAVICLILAFRVWRLERKLSE
ncbi:MAG: helix-turn-helix domain-containing protein [Lawsonibacter sp.]|jgi:transcriptional regulator with XRE-family HTH domain